VNQLLDRGPTNVIQLYEGTVRGARVSDSTPWHRKLVLYVAATIAAMTFSAVVYFGSPTQTVYVTGIGEQSSYKLQDGSVVVLNTDTQVKVDYSREARNLRLVKGEALFRVEREAGRPFVVTAGDTSVRAIGTEFNVRRRGEGATEVAVVEGVVQVTAAPRAALGDAGALKLAAGEQARVTGAGVKVSGNQSPDEVLSWRQRRLAFKDARLADVAAEFNRYNHSQLRVEGAAQEMRMTGIFDADHPQALALYAQKNPALTVRADGDNWIIRARE
jgi:transmembrane sensor